MGGFVVTLVYGFSRPAADLDVLEISPREAGKPMLQLGMQGGPLHKKYQIYHDPVGVAHVPESYEERLTEIFPKSFTHLPLCALDPYDLALSKLERNIQGDRDDVKYLARTVPLELQVLTERYHPELRWQLGNPEREDLTLKLWIDAIEEEKRQLAAYPKWQARLVARQPSGDELEFRSAVCAVLNGGDAARHQHRLSSL
jgi:hypothetical protein